MCKSQFKQKLIVLLFLIHTKVYRGTQLQLMFFAFYCAHKEQSARRA